MGYYEERQRAFMQIEAILRKNSSGISPEFLYYYITTNFKIGEKTIEKRVDLLKKIGKISESGGVLTWIHTKNTRK